MQPLQMLLMDTHAHIYLPEFDNDREQIIHNAASLGIEKILMPAIDSSTHEAMLQLEKKQSNCIAMMGLHPCSVKETVDSELEIVEGYLAKQDFAAIGEIGLDFYWDKTFTQQQYHAFHRQIKLALEYDLPIAIHSRNATMECIEVIKKYPGLKGVFHCFSGNIDQAQQLIELGFLLGIGGVVTFKNAGLDKVIEALGIDAVILETDAPYLAPVPFRGKRNEPAYTKLIAEKIAGITGQDINAIAEITSGNAIQLFKL